MDAYHSVCGIPCVCVLVSQCIHWAILTSARFLFRILFYGDLLYSNVYKCKLYILQILTLIKMYGSIGLSCYQNCTDHNNPLYKMWLFHIGVCKSEAPPTQMGQWKLSATCSASSVIIPYSVASYIAYHAVDMQLTFNIQSLLTRSKGACRVLRQLECLLFYKDQSGM